MVTICLTLRINLDCHLAPQGMERHLLFLFRSFWNLRGSKNSFDGGFWCFLHCGIFTIPNLCILLSTIYTIETFVYLWPSFGVIRIVLSIFKFVRIVLSIFKSVRIFCILWDIFRWSFHLMPWKRVTSLLSSYDSFKPLTRFSMILLL